MVDLLRARRSRQPRVTFLVAAIVALVAVILERGRRLRRPEVHPDRRQRPAADRAGWDALPDRSEVRVCKVGSFPCIGLQPIRKVGGCGSIGG